MNLNKKVLITFLSFVLAMLVIACSCSSLIPFGSSTPSTGQEAMPGLAGKWTSPDTNDIFEIAWQNGQYVVLSATWESSTYSITSQSWNGSTLTWAYHDSDNGLDVTISTVSLSGSTLTIDFSESDGTTGTTILNRVP